MPALGISLILIAVGAILAFAVTTAVEGVAIQTIGVILMAVGGLGVLMSLLFMMSFSPFARTHEDHVDHHV
jgi:Zn-dependent protease with chaperone function